MVGKRNGIDTDGIGQGVAVGVNGTRVEIATGVACHRHKAQPRKRRLFIDLLDLLLKQRYITAFRYALFAMF